MRSPVRAGRGDFAALALAALLLTSACGASGPRSEEPDLILAAYSALSESEHALLPKLVPTVAQPAQHADSGAPWQEQTRTAGAALRDDPGHRGLAVPR